MFISGLRKDSGKLAGRLAVANQGSSSRRNEQRLRESVLVAVPVLYQPIPLHSEDLISLWR
jgi:hypothetical protein